jgi:hypothetical protein
MIMKALNEISGVLYVVISFIMLSIAYAQPNPDTLWTFVHGESHTDIVRGVCLSDDGGYVLISDFNINNKWHLSKVSSDGELLWDRSYFDELSGAPINHYPKSVVQTPDGGYAMAGWREQYDPNAPVYVVEWAELVLVKTNAEGDTLWTLLHRDNYMNTIYDISLTPDGRYILAGQSQDYRFGPSHGYVAMVNRTGQLLWTRNYGTREYHCFYSIDSTIDNGYILAGWLGTPAYDFYLVKINSAGDTLWTREYRGNMYYKAYDVKQSFDGDFLLVGNGIPYDCSMIETDNLGNTNWDLIWGLRYYNYPYSIALTNDSGYVIAGYTADFGANKDILLFKLNADGEVLWYRTYGGDNDEEAFSILLDDNGCYVIGGYTKSYGSGGKDLYLIRTGPDQSSATPSEVTEEVPRRFFLNNAFPNPFNSVATIKFDVAVSGKIKVDIYNVFGNFVATLADHQVSPGQYSVTWNAGDLSSGIYFCRMQAGDFQQVRKVVLLK